MINNYTSTTNTRGQINAVISVQEYDSGAGSGSPIIVTEPISLAEVKEYAKIDYDDEDTLLTSLITTAREILEDYTGVSFIPKRLQAILQNDCGGIEIPYGPIFNVFDPTLITDIAGNEVEIVTKGGDFPYIETPINYVELIYSAGYYYLPEVFKTALKAQIFFQFENRGERLSFSNQGVRTYSVSYVCDAAQTLLAKKRRAWDAMM